MRQFAIPYEDGDICVAGCWIGGLRASNQRPVVDRGPALNKIQTASASSASSAAYLICVICVIFGLLICVICGFCVICGLSAASSADSDQTFD